MLSKALKKKHKNSFCEQNHSYYDNSEVLQVEKTRKLKRKEPKKSIFKKIISVFFAAVLLGLYAYYVCPYNFRKYIRPLFLNRILNMSFKPDIIAYMFKSEKYLHNSFLIDRYLITPRTQNIKEMADINIVSELKGTKLKLVELAKKYPKLESSIFVWEYSTGSGLEINSDKIFPSASIIKIPIAFELIKLIDRTSKTINPVSLSDKRVFSEFFRTIGSGALQFTKADVPYTLDYLANIMISESDNSATNMLLYEIGGMDGFNRAMRNLGLKATSMNEWLPDLDGTNKTTAKEISKILYNIDNPNYINPKYKVILKEYLGNTKNIHLLKEKLPSGVMVLHKTGNIASMLGDCGIIYANNGKKYIAAILVKRPHNDYSAKSFIQEASLIIYNDINKL